MLTNEEIFAKDKSDYLPVFARYNIVLDHGDGPYVYDTKGKKYIDFLAGIAVNVVGHNYKPLVDAVSQQASKMIHCSNLYYTEVQVEAAEKLKNLSGMDKVCLLYTSPSPRDRIKFSSEIPVQKLMKVLSNLLVNTQLILTLKKFK